jgi:hypothetical protein
MNKDVSEEQIRKEIDAIVHPLLSDPMDMNKMYATTDKIMKVFENYIKHDRSSTNIF